MPHDTAPEESSGRIEGDVAGPPPSATMAPPIQTDEPNSAWREFLRLYTRPRPLPDGPR